MHEFCLLRHLLIYVVCLIFPAIYTRWYVLPCMWHLFCHVSRGTHTSLVSVVPCKNPQMTEIIYGTQRLKYPPCTCTCRFQKAFLSSISPWVLLLFAKLIFFGNQEPGHLTIFAYSDTCRLCCMCDISCNMFELDCLTLYATFVVACVLRNKYCPGARLS